MMVKRLWLLGLLGAVMGVGGCGGDSDDGREGQGASGPALDEVPALYADAACDVLSGCLDEFIVNLFLGGVDCTEFFTATLEDGQFAHVQQAVDDGRVEYHASAVDGCIEGIRDLGCDLFSGWYLPECEAALTGTVAEGGDCTIDDECEGDLVCRVDSSCPGSCAQRGEAGDDCEENEDCASGLVCNGDPGRCASPVQEGQPCNDTNAPCAFGLDCVPDAESGDDVCLAWTNAMSESEGASCNLVDSQADITLCDPSLVCELEVVDADAGTFTQTCREPAASSGGVCRFAFPDECPTGEFCDVDPDAGVWESVCRPLPIDGQACAGLNPDQNPEEGDCAPGHVCVESEVGGPTCRERQRIDGDCVDDAQCYSENCESGTCAAPDPCE